ncbi:hypothetical protein I317_01200 [Kwoniella heveanensis CBS 569]|uniref:ZZ-type domain-containing protein n=1 Tax=Kwoniella heveanensis BCC8398 TaxID=1296120 RepID=A0A1B9GJV8_9TREE|nr:hypothetical protein I316_06949 [Kwoniella heveanensis BCC8398]OCF44921.1 hypothetical protein I317_01200 [Kwoniella heveanensis CBS 569]
MLKPTSGQSIPDRPNRPLVIKCSYDGSARRITFPSAATCRLDSLRSRVEDCFSLSASPFSLTYTDDDGEDFSIRNESDLTEAISYFISGDDDAALSNYSGSSSGHMPYGFSSQKITIRLDVLVEYDGPSLSDTSSLSSFQTGSGSGSGSGSGGSEQDGTSLGGWRRSSEYGESHLSYRSGTSRRDDRASSSHGSNLRSSLSNDLESLHLSHSSSSSTQLRSSVTPRNRSERNDDQDTAALPPPAPILTGPESDPAPSLLTHSELGSRWLMEQSKLAARKLGGPPSKPNSRIQRYESDEESGESDDEDQQAGDLALVRDARGRYYYSYTDSSSIASRSDLAPGAGPSRLQRASGFSSSLTLSTSPPQTPYESSQPFEPVRVAEPFGPPIFAPDCSACGVRLEYMRYVCLACGENEMWQENAHDKPRFLNLSDSGDGDASDGSSSEATELAGTNDDDPFATETVYQGGNSRSRSSSTSTETSRGSLRAAIGAPSSPATTIYKNGNRLRTIASSNSINHDRNGTTIHTHAGGYELCPTCVEVHGIEHTRAQVYKSKASAGRHSQPADGMRRHTFREKIWAAEGWVDVVYEESMNCSICRNSLIKNRYKCISCSNFNLCMTCHREVEEIHPAHAFLSLPDKSIAMTAHGASNGLAQPDIAGSSSQPLRHPGVFCHNCLQDIVGPRFHCAVCPSWELCIQCEGIAVSGSDGSGHAADHIMMKIPVPLPNHEVEAVSRRARDRWFHQDRTVATAASFGQVNDETRSSSPTNDTVYAPTISRVRGPSPLPPPSQVINIPTRDSLDHGVRCGNCNEWIMGKRYQCANCPSLPQAFNLCTICELRSYRVHDPTHVFFKFDRPVHIPLRSARPLLPLLYRHSVGKVPTSAVASINPRDPTAYLKHVLHKETLCDVHGDQIRGIWFRCAHCAAGYDLCQEAEQTVDHDPTHVFVVFKGRVDMASFRALADLGSEHSKPLLKQQVYHS